MPSILIFNLWGKFVNQIGFNKLFQFSAFKSLSENHNIHLLPIYNYKTNFMHDRSEVIQYELEKITNEKNLEQFNLVSFQMSGLDTRLVLEENKNIKERVKKLLMIGTPNNGSALGQIMINKNTSFNQELIARVLGVHPYALREIATSCIKEIQDYLEDQDVYNYYSINGDKDQTQMSTIFQDTSRELLRSQNVSEDQYFTDGIFFDVETKAFKHKENFNADQSDLSIFTRNQDLVNYVQKFLQI